MKCSCGHAESEHADEHGPCRHQDCKCGQFLSVSAMDAALARIALRRLEPEVRAKIIAEFEVHE